MDRYDRIRNYLVRALEMTKSCVVVMKYTQNEPVSRTKLEYISENVQQLGMNLASLKGGFRLPKDYIHPEDRDGFIDAVSIAAETKTSFTYRVRLAGDDGVLRNVDIRSEYMDLDEDYYLIEYVFQEIVTPEEKESRGKEEKFGGGWALTKEIFSNEELSELFGSFANAYGLYSTVVDQNGHALLPPVGPDAYLGYYYDMFERPENGEFFETLKRSTMMQEEAVYSELGDGNPDSRVSAVPLRINGVYLATWVLCAHDKSQGTALKMASLEQYKVGRLISGYIQRAVIAGRQTDQEKDVERQLNFEIKKRTALDEIQDLMHNPNIDRLHAILSKAADVLDVDYAFFLRRKGSGPSERIVRDSWCMDGQMPLSDVQIDGFNESFGEEERAKLLTGGYVVDQLSMTNRIRVNIFQGIARAAIVMPIPVGGKPAGRVYFIESRKERVWTESEVHFAYTIARLLGSTVEIMEGNGIKRRTSQSLLDVFRYIEEEAFIREDATGKVIYVNEALTRRLGMDITGHDSRRLIPEGRGDYESYPGSIHVSSEGPDQEIRSWQRYINELGAIYDVTEIPVEWTDGRAATAVLLKRTSE